MGGSTRHGRTGSPDNQNWPNEIIASVRADKGVHPIVRHRAMYYEGESSVSTFNSSYRTKIKAYRQSRVVLIWTLELVLVLTDWQDLSGTREWTTGPPVLLQSCVGGLAGPELNPPSFQQPFLLCTKLPFSHQPIGPSGPCGSFGKVFGPWKTPEQKRYCEEETKKPTRKMDQEVHQDKREQDHQWGPGDLHPLTHQGHHHSREMWRQEEGPDRD